jgi:hypothetical protein
VNRFIGSSLVVTTISSYTLKITVTIAHVTSYTKSSNSSGLTVLPLERRNSSEVNSHSRILSYPLATDHAQKTQFYCCVLQTTQKTSHVITILPVHWRTDYCLAMSYKHLSYSCVTLSKVFIMPLPSYTRYNTYERYRQDICQCRLLQQIIHYLTTTKRQLVNLTVVCLTATKFKPLMLLLHSLFFSNCMYISI